MTSRNRDARWRHRDRGSRIEEARIRYLEGTVGAVIVVIALAAVGGFFYVGANDSSRASPTGPVIQRAPLDQPALPSAGAGMIPQAPGLFGQPPALVGSSYLLPAQSAPVSTPPPSYLYPGYPSARPLGYSSVPATAHAGTAVSPVAGTTLLTPRQQGAANKKLVEGHWHGMELLELVPALARQYQLNPGQKGLLVDEVSLAAAETGILAGDVVASIGGMRVANLQDIRDATYVVRNQKEVDIGLWRNGQPHTVILRAGVGTLGFAMFEAASPILPGAISPHRNRGRPCTECHIIMANGGQLPIDAGDILPTPPPITAGAQPRHGNRGPCVTCHTILAPAAGSPTAGQPVR